MQNCKFFECVDEILCCEHSGKYCTSWSQAVLFCTTDCQAANLTNKSVVNVIWVNALGSFMILLESVFLGLCLTHFTHRHFFILYPGITFEQGRKVSSERFFKRGADSLKQLFSLKCNTLPPHCPAWTRLLDHLPLHPFVMCSDRRSAPPSGQHWVRRRRPCLMR